MLKDMLSSVAQALLFTLIPFLFWLIAARKKQSFFIWLGLRKPHCAKPGITLVITVAAAAAYILAMTLCLRILPAGVTTAGAQYAGQGINSALPVLLFAFVRTALSEEILFRGFLLKRIQNRTGFKMANAIQAILFGLMHGLPFGLATRSAGVSLLLTVLPGLFGAYQGWLNEKRCSGSILPSWLLHGFMNLTTAVLSL